MFAGSSYGCEVKILSVLLRVAGLGLSLALVGPAGLRAQPDAKAPPNVAPEPTLADVAYGPHERNVLDFWRAKSDQPTPLVVFIHGGGFVSGDKSGARRDRLVQECLNAGVSFMAINYRFLAPGVGLQHILRDSARAIQFARSKAAEWNLDKRRIAAFGGSAGAGTSVWLAVHDDLADPTNTDPVLRESTRLAVAGSNQGQFTYDFVKWTEAFGEEVTQRFRGRIPPHAYYALRSEADLYSDQGKKIRADCDLVGLISRDDPPIFISSTLPTLAWENNNQYLHHPKHSQILYDRLREVGVPVVANIPALKIAPPEGGPANWREFVFTHLGVKAATRTGTR